VNSLPQTKISPTKQTVGKRGDRGWIKRGKQVVKPNLSSEKFFAKAPQKNYLKNLKPTPCRSGEFFPWLKPRTVIFLLKILILKFGFTACF